MNIDGTQLTLGAVVALVIIKEVIGFLKWFLGSKKNSESKLEKQIEDLWNWHNVSDEDGIKVWYVRKSFEKSVDKLSESISTQNELLRKLDNKMDTMHREGIHAIHDLLSDAHKHP